MMKKFLPKRLRKDYPCGTIRLRVAFNGKDAIDQVGKQNMDVVILDVSMPGMEWH